jgi:heme exporter protein D
MAYLDIDFVIPIALLAASIVGVVVVRTAILRGERIARERTQKLIERHGMSEADRASVG